MHGIHYAVSMFIATAVLWLLVHELAETNPVWAITSFACWRLGFQNALAYTPPGWRWGALAPASANLREKSLAPFHFLLAINTFLVYIGLLRR